MDGRPDQSPDQDAELTLLSREELEEIVRSRSATLGHVMDAMVDVLFKLNADGRIEMVNRSVESTLGYDSDSVIGKPLDALLVSPGAETPTDELVTAGRFGELLVRDGHVPDVEVAFRAADGSVIPMSLSTSAMDESESGSGGFVCVGKDIRDRIERERSLAETNEQLELLNTLVRHDIRNDVILIINLVKQLQSALGDPDDHVVLGAEEHKDLEDIERISRRIMSLTETARRLIETVAKLEDQRTPTPLGPVLELEVMNASILSSDAVVEVEGTFPDVSVWANELLSSVFRNLLTNAIHHNDSAEPVVTVSTTVTDTDVTVRIADNGPGLPADLLASLQSDGRSIDPSGPHGYGLYIVETILEQYGGQLTVEVADHGVDADTSSAGTTFSVTLPRVLDL